MTQHDDDADDELPPFRLDDRIRAGLCPDLDHEALEELMSMLPEEIRPEVFRYFLDWSQEDPEDVLIAFPEIDAEGPPGERTFLLPQPEYLHFEIPELQAQLERVLAKRILWWTPGDVTPRDA